MSTEDKPAGVDLARVALAAARKAAKERGAHTSATQNAKRRPASRRNGRDPMGLGGALAHLVAEQGWESPAAGGSVMDRWPTITTPEIAEHLRAVAYDHRAGRLDLVPSSNAWATQARLITAQLIQKANAAAGTEAVRHIRVLPVGARTPQAPTTPVEPAAPAPCGEVRTRESASAGYHRARAAIVLPPDEPSPPPPRTRPDGCDGYQHVMALVKSPPAARRTTDRAPVRTREDGCAGYRQTLAEVGAPPQARTPDQAALHTREAASAGYHLTPRALLDGKVRNQTRPT
ncbi:DciA family protein [Streptomyces sp. WM6378]|uniref:DciA family protein n=1 Tax=Streptomyces sp. WM6378 TaxID=1415557 RepID=UPI0006AF320E|nr:DUF721 domain-containing protein [Streptomyces sp. WM6378]